MEQKEETGYGVAGFVLGLLSILLFWLSILVLPLSILGIIFSSIQLKRHKTGLAVAGLILSIIGTVLPLVIVFAVTLIWAAIIPTVHGELDATSCFDAVSQLSIENNGKTCVTPEGNLNIEVSRAGGDFNLEGLNFLILGHGNAMMISDPYKIPSPNENILITFNDKDYSSIQSISLIPVIEGNKSCDRSAEISIMPC